jgi:superfamily II DNA or RNA helicase
MGNKYRKVLKRKSSYSYRHPKTGKIVKVPSHKQHYNIRIYRPITRSKAQEAFNLRSDRSKSIDKATLSKNTKEEPDEGWLEHPNRADVRGIDTPESVRKRFNKIRFKKGLNNLQEIALQFNKVNELLYESAKEHLNQKQINRLEKERTRILKRRKDLKESTNPKSYNFCDAKRGVYIAEKNNGGLEISFDYLTYKDEVSDKNKWRSYAKWDPSNKIWHVYKNQKDKAFDLLFNENLIPDKPKKSKSLRQLYLPKNRRENSIVIEIDEEGAKMDGDHSDLKKLSDYYSYQAKGYKYSKAYKDGRWDGRIRIISLGKQTLPENLAYNILQEKDQIFNDKDINIEILDFRKNATRKKPYKLKDIKLYDYQQDAVRQALDAKQGLITVATGGGKTEIAGGIIAEYGVENDTIFLVHTTALQDQAEERLELRLGKDVGVGGGVNHDIKDTPKGDINVVTLQSLHKAIKARKEGEELSKKQKEMVKAYDDSELIIQDEAHHIKADTFKEVFDEGKTKHKYGLTATPYRDENDEKEVFSRFGKEIVNIPPDDLIRKGKLVPPKIHMIDVSESKEAKKVKQMYRPGAKRYNAIRRAQIIQNKSRNNFIKEVAEKQKQLGKTSLIFVDRIDHGNRLAKTINTPFLNGQNQSAKNRKKNQEVIKKLKEGKLRTVVATQQLFGEGFDLPAIDSLIIADAGGMSKVKTMQRAGRALRTKKGKKETEIFDFADKTDYLYEHANMRLNTYKQNQEFKVVKHKNPQEWKDNRLEADRNYEKKQEK